MSISVNVPRMHGRFTLMIRQSIDKGGIVWIFRPNGTFFLATSPNPYYPVPKSFVKRVAP